MSGGPCSREERGRAPSREGGPPPYEEEKVQKGLQRKVVKQEGAAGVGRPGCMTRRPR